MCSPLFDKTGEFVEDWASLALQQVDFSHGQAAKRQKRLTPIWGRDYGGMRMRISRDEDEDMEG